MMKLRTLDDDTVTCRRSVFPQPRPTSELMTTFFFAQCLRATLPKAGEMSCLALFCTLYLSDGTCVCVCVCLWVCFLFNKLHPTFNATPLFWGLFLCLIGSNFSIRATKVTHIGLTADCGNDVFSHKFPLGPFLCLIG